MKKKVLAMALASVTAISMLAGCGAPAASNEAAPQETEAEEVSAPAEVAETEVSAPEETPSGEVETLKVGMMGKGTKPVGVIVADAMGYFEEEGVNVEFEQVASMNDAYIAVANGDLDVYLFSSTAAATFISQGTDTLRVFGGTAGEGSEIMAAGDSDITLSAPEDFEGLTIGCFMAETGQMVLKNWLLEEGLTIGDETQDADVTFIYYNDEQSGIEAVKNGDFDLILTNSSKGYFAEDMGIQVVAEVKDFVPVYPCCRQTCNLTTYEEKADALVKFETAALRGYEYFLNEEEGTLDILEAYAEADRDFLKGQFYGTDSYEPSMRITLDPDKDACVAFYEAMVNTGAIEPVSDINWADYVVTDIYSTALQTLMDREPENTLWTDFQEYFEEHDTI